MVTRIVRYAQIVDILSKYGFGIGLEKLFPGAGTVQAPGSRKDVRSSTIYERIRLALEELGPTFVKFGQIMSTRTELLPPEMIEQLKKLQDHAKPIPFSEVMAVIEENCPHWEDCFCDIEETPVASASIGQVHRAYLKDGTKVAAQDPAPGHPGDHRDGYRASSSPWRSASRRCSPRPGSTTRSGWSMISPTRS